METDANQPFFYYNGSRFEARMGVRGPYDHWFGQARRIKISNPPASGQLHQVLDLDLRDPALGLVGCGLDRLPLLYGFQFEGDDRLEYIIRSSEEIEVTTLNEDSYYASWPYEGYPTSFRKMPFSLTNPAPTAFGEFTQAVWQSVDKSDSKKFIAVVPPSSLYGVHLGKRAAILTTFM